MVSIGALPESAPGGQSAPPASAESVIMRPAATKHRRLRVATFTSIFPNAQDAGHGLFVRERVRALARLCELVVVAPVPWAPKTRALGQRYFRYSQVPPVESDGTLSVLHPRFVVIPKVAKTTHGLMMALSCLRAVRALKRSFGFDIVDSHWAYPDGVAAVLLARWLRVPSAVTVRGDDINIFAREFWRGACIRWALRRADVVIALSRELEERVLELGVDPSRVAVIRNGINGGDFYPVTRGEARRRLGVAADVQVLFSAGRLHDSKGFPVIVEAAGLLCERFPNLQVFIAGAADSESDATPAILAAAAKVGISERVHLIGPQPRVAMRDWYSAADLFCLPTSREGSANVLNESLACGLPCITTPVGGNPEVITSAELGILTAPDAGAFADAIAAGLTTRWDRSRIAAHASGRTWTVVATECHDLLQARVPAPTVWPRSQSEETDRHGQTPSHDVSAHIQAISERR